MPPKTTHFNPEDDPRSTHAADPSPAPGKK
jgi:hypothetical protein